MTSALRRVACACAVVVAVSTPAAAQSPADGRIELSAGVGWFGRMQFPSVDATQSAPGETQRTVFRTNASLNASAGLAVRVGTRLTPWLAAETTLQLNPRQLSVTVRDDAEAASVTASEDVTEYLFEGGVRVTPRSWQGRRLVPFVSAGAGYLRQLNEGQTLVDTGHSVYAGGGAHYWLRRRATGWIRSTGIRVDTRVSVFGGGVATDGGRHAQPAAGAGFFLTF